ncbi:MAG: thioredoxin TrxC [Deltaproteobacteria bacterium]|nr:thioredoxin TrxC [Deltaproteobacteria bacterium]
MQDDQIIIRCLNCGTKNRIPRNKLQEKPTCGKCHALLDEIIIRCLNCGAKNRMPEERLNDRPLCGRCKAPLVVKEDKPSTKPVNVTDDNFAGEILSFPGPVLVDCWAPWCGPCRLVAPIMEELAAQYAGTVKIAKLNVDENVMTASRYEIRSIPTMLLFKDGKVVNKLVGAQPKQEIEKHLLALISSQ